MGYIISCSFMNDIFMTFFRKERCEPVCFWGVCELHSQQILARARDAPLSFFPRNVTKVLKVVRTHGHTQKSWHPKVIKACLPWRWLAEVLVDGKMGLHYVMLRMVVESEFTSKTNSALWRFTARLRMV